MKQFAVLHTEKGKISSGGTGNHIDRKVGAERTYRHADPNRRHLNIIVSLHQDRHLLKLSEAIKSRIKEGYNTRNKKGELKEIRRDAVKYCTHILSGSHEQMKKIAENEAYFNAWLVQNYEFMSEEFGRENIVRFVVHMDEKTPHIHCVTVPLTKDGRLSAKEVIGNREDMQKRQDRYAEAMKPFELERGIKNTGIKHEDASEYYKRISQTNDINDNISDFSKNYLGVKVIQEKKVESVLKSLKSISKERDMYKEKIQSLKEDLNYRETRSLKFRKLENQLNEEIRKNNKLLNHIHLEAERMKREKELDIQRAYEKGQKSVVQDTEVFNKVKDKVEYEEKLKEAQNRRKGFRI